jgi:hypothetical protein
MTGSGKANLASGDIQSGQPVTVEYDGTDMVVVTPVANVQGLTGVVTTSRTITAGSGLAGGGDLSADRTLAVGAGTGIAVASDTVAIDKATSTQMQSPTTSGINKVVTGDNFQFHPGSAKGWVSFNGGSGAINGGAGVGSYNVASVTRNGVGDYTVAWATGFSSTGYAVAIWGQRTTASDPCFITMTSIAASSLRFATRQSNGTAEDYPLITVIALGSQ